MSRPPIKRSVASPRGVDIEQGENTYFGMRFAELVALAEALASDPGGVPIPGASGTIAPGIIEIPGKDRGLARTLVEIPALFAHILGEHQSHYAAQAYLGTASQMDSLIRHARRLAYQPDQGVAATGLAVFDVKDGLEGTVRKHFALQSEPSGETRAQTYETLEELHVKDAWNAILPVQAQVPTRVVFRDGVALVPLAEPSGLGIGDITILRGRGQSVVCEVIDAQPETLRVARLSPDDATPPTSEPYTLLARPSVAVRVFGHAADPLAFPPENLANPATYTAPSGTGTASFGYTVTGLTSGSYSPGASLILAEATAPLAAGALAALVQPGSATTYSVTQSREAAVSFRRGERIAIPQPDPVPSGFPTDQLVERAVSARTSVLDVVDPDGPVTWAEFPLAGVLYADWTREIAVASTQPNTQTMNASVTLAADLAQIRPGRTVIVERLSDGFATEATLVRLQAVTGGWQVDLSFAAGGVAANFTLGDVRIRANAALVSHGESTGEVLGASDGVTAYQNFDLKTSGVTRINGAQGSTPELAVRVDGVLWDRVEDFHAAAPEARVYRTEANDEQKMSIVFGGEGRGAVPPSGTRNVTAEYRTGLGRVGDVPAGRLTRVKKASPILDAVTNPLPLDGGTDPARPDDMRHQATRSIRTFGRAVSLQDHADLALLLDGVARASARWLDRGAVELIAADADGNAPADSDALLAFLNARRDANVPLILLPPQPVDVVIALRVERDRSWLEDAVRRSVADALLSTEELSPGLFTFAARAFSAPQSLSGLYDHLLAVDGVTGVEASRFSVAPQTGVVDIIHATDRQWLRLQPNHLIVDVVEPGALIPDLERGVS